MNIDTLIQTIQNLCNQHNTNVDKMLKACALKPSVVDNMKKGSMPSIDKICLIANYFNVSMDYLLNGREPISFLSEDKQRLLTMYDLLSDMEKGEILGELKEKTKERYIEKVEETA